VDVWFWVAVAVAAGVAISSLVWWSSGRARMRTPRQGGLLTPEERARLDLDTIDTSLNRHGLWGGAQ